MAFPVADVSPLEILQQRQLVDRLQIEHTASKVNINHIDSSTDRTERGKSACRTTAPSSERVMHVNRSVGS